MISFVLRTQAVPCSSRRLAKAAVKIISDSIDDADTVFNLDLILSEACANVVRHAYRDIPAKDLEIVVFMELGDYIRLDISDWGRGFPELPVAVQNAAPTAEGGRGLYIMSELGDNFDIKSEQGKNTISIQINVEESLWKPFE